MGGWNDGRTGGYGKANRRPIPWWPEMEGIGMQWRGQKKGDGWMKGTADGKGGLEGRKVVKVYKEGRK